MRRFRPVSAVLFAIALSALVGGLFGRSALAIDDQVPDHYKTFTAALSAIESSYVDKVDSDRARVQRHPGHAGHARSALELLRSARIRADARAAGGPVLRPRRLDPGHRRRHHGDDRVRRIAGVQEGHPARRRHRQDRRRERQGLDDGAGDAQAPRPEGHAGADRDPPAGLRSADSDRADTRRSAHPDRAGVFHGRRDHRLRSAAGLGREHRSRDQSRRCAI